MSIILQNSTTQRFVCGGKTNVRWSYDQEHAEEFETGVEAYDYCRAQKLTDMDIVLSFNNSTYNVKVTVRDRVL